MRGYVEGIRPWLRVPLLIGGQRLVVDFQVDTAFVGSLTMPAASVGALNLLLVRQNDYVLADGTRGVAHLYGVEIEWFGIATLTSVLGVGTRPLIGAELLDGCELNIRYEENGEVRLSPL
jgi:clan AA aspartic protease